MFAAQLAQLSRITAIDRGLAPRSRPLSPKYRHYFWIRFCTMIILLTGLFNQNSVAQKIIYHSTGHVLPPHRPLS
jgi:hypothetical protein